MGKKTQTKMLDHHMSYTISTSISLQARALHQGPLQAISPAPYPPSGQPPQSSYSGQNCSRAPPLAHPLTELLLTPNFAIRLPCDLLSLPWQDSALRVFLPVSPDRTLMDVLPSNTWRALVRHPLSEQTDSLLPCPLTLRCAPPP
jgi:hypothetical protein